MRQAGCTSDLEQPLSVCASDIYACIQKVAQSMKRDLLFAEMSQTELVAMLRSRARKSGTQTSHFRGVSLLKQTGKWHAQINVGGKQVCSMTHDTLRINGLCADLHENAMASVLTRAVSWSSCAERPGLHVMPVWPW